MPLLITADDYGYAGRYDAGIAEAARAGAVDGVSVMVMRGEFDPASLLAADAAIGLHLEAGEWTLGEQVASFEAAVGRPPEYLDGHHHCHARGPLAVEVAEFARERGLPVRSVDARHRRLLRCKGVVTADRLVGRYSEEEPVLPAEIAAVLRGEGRWGRGDEKDELVEWMVHPGYAGGEVGSDYDAGRGEDLGVLLELANEPALREIRTSWRERGASRP